MKEDNDNKSVSEKTDVSDEKESFTGTGSPVFKFSKFSASVRDNQRKHPAVIVTSVSVVVVMVILVGFLAVKLSQSTNNTGPSAPVFEIVTPQDGNLVIGETSIPQMLGTCEPSGSCRYIPPTPMVNVSTSGTVTLPIKASQSSSFSFAVGAGPEPAIQLRAVNGQLLISGAHPGTWTVTTTGNARGAWMYKLTLTGNDVVPPAEEKPVKKKKK